MSHPVTGAARSLETGGRMRVGIIGAGNMGSAFARRLSSVGHDVFIASRDIEDARNVAATVGAKVRPVPQQQLAESADVLIAAVPYAQQAEALRASGRLEGKTVIEISNPLTPDMSGLTVGHTTSAAEEVAKSASGAKVVKAFNTIFAQVLAERLSSTSAAKVQVFYAGDDAAAKRSVHALIESMGFEPVDAGPLSNSRYLEPMGMLNIYFGYVAKMGTDIAPAVRKVSAQAAEPRAEQAARQPGQTGSVAGRDEGARPSAG
ncbi:MAG TPA: NADPH-dependent F420 reductase [Gemmatimonadaceae bacterium]|nr:NADPH-dependent F420 reductase [Gemmatimonadaceae bacterium]